MPLDQSSSSSTWTPEFTEPKDTVWDLSRSPVGWPQRMIETGWTAPKSWDKPFVNCCRIAHTSYKNIAVIWFFTTHSWCGDMGYHNHDRCQSLRNDEISQDLTRKFEQWFSQSGSTTLESSILLMERVWKYVEIGGKPIQSKSYQNRVQKSGIDDKWHSQNQHSL